MKNKRAFASILSITLGLSAAILSVRIALAIAQIDLVGPPESEAFGKTVTALPNSNIVVTDPGYDNWDATDAGAVYLYDGASGELISMLTGSLTGDQVGSGGVITLTNGNYVILSPDWNNGLATDAGAVTWADGTTGITGTVGIANSLVGSSANDRVGYGLSGSSGVVALGNGSYVVLSPGWDNGLAADAGAVTWADGTTGIAGPVTETNSLVGRSDDDQVGYDGVTLLANGNYVVRSPYWNNDALEDAGAATWADGSAGITGPVSVTNSLVGGSSYDRVGANGVTALKNGNYVVCSPYWNNGTVVDAGAATWGNGTTGITGPISVTNSLVGSAFLDRVGAGAWALPNGHYVTRSTEWNDGPITDAGAVTWGNGTVGISGIVTVTNSLVGSSASDRAGSSGITVLENGNYVVHSAYWDHGPIADAGAATWGNGATGITGPITIANSLVGSAAGDQVGSGSATSLSNGNYVVRSPDWDNGAVPDAGAATWGNGLTGLTGTVTVANSLVGSTADDRVGTYVAALGNGSYVVHSPGWDSGAITDVGAATWGNGTTGIAGAVSAVNSLVGSSTGDRVGYGVIALSNGHYVVHSPYWDHGAATDAGAVTWGNGTTGITGAVSTANSLAGGAAGDQVGDGVVALSNDHYVVYSPLWNNGALANAGAVSWGNGTTGITGVVSAGNSLVGSSADDRVGEDVTALKNGHYVVHSPGWDRGATADAGAVTLGDGNAGTTTGPVIADNSVRGTAGGGGANLNFAYDQANDQLVVGRPADNVVTLFRLNEHPMADAGVDQSVKSASLVTLDGSASSDPDGNLPLSFAWTQNGGTPVVLNSPDTSQPTFIAPAVVAQTETLTFTLVVTDALGRAGLPDQVVVAVEPYRLFLPAVLKH